jgi:hypothetical protein
VTVIYSVLGIWHNSSIIARKVSRSVTPPNGFRNEMQFLEFLMDLRSDVITKLYRVKYEYLNEHLRYYAIYTIFRYFSPFFALGIYFGLEKYASEISNNFGSFLIIIAMCLMSLAPIIQRRESISIIKMEHILHNAEEFPLEKNNKEVLSRIEDYQKLKANLMLVLTFVLIISGFLSAMVAIVIINHSELSFDPISIVLDIIGAVLLSLMYFVWSIVVFMTRITDSHINEYFIENTPSKVEVRVLVNIGKQIFPIRGQLIGLSHSRITIKDADNFIQSFSFKHIENISAKDT